MRNVKNLHRISIARAFVLTSMSGCKTGNTTYLAPLVKALELEKLLKEDKNCDIVICLSHLGYRYSDKKISDIVLAKNTNYIDLLIGGHTHTFLDIPESARNLKGKETLISQVGFAGINLGRIDFHFKRSDSQKISFSSATEGVKSIFKI